MLMVMVAFAATADAQGFLKRLKDRAVNAAENAVSNKVDSKVNEETNKAMDDVLDGNKSSKKSKNSKSDDADADAEDDTPVAQNQKSDFVRGSVILFEDDFSNEQMGEFPSKWDISDGSLEVASVNGKKYAHSNSSGTTVFSPLMQNMKSYLPDVFTLEWEEFMCKPGDIQQMDWHIYFYQGDDEIANIYKMFRPGNPDVYGNYSFKKGSGASGEVTGDLEWGDLEKCVKLGQWNHFAISFNKRAFKYYINGQRVINLPNVAAPSRFEFHVQDGYPYRGVGHVILAKGAADLYQRQTTDLSAVEKAIAETGKFVTNNILFETGKATLKPESMAEIQKVADYMKKNASVRFEVQGHTDNQGSDAVNDPLSQQRAEAVVKALEGLGCDPFNMRAVGKGSHEPVADNATEAGRAKNRRVEFIKK